MRYNPADHYWIVADNETRVWASARAAFVPVEDAAYVEWQALEGVATRIVSEGELIQVLREQYPAGHLLAYTGAARDQAIARGVSIGGMPVKTDAESQRLINGAYTKAKEDPERTFRFKAATGYVTLTAAQMILIGDAVFDHVQACFSTEADVLDAIEAGDITSADQVDQAFA